MKLLFQLLRKSLTKQKIIMVGTGYANFQWCEQRINDGSIEVIAFIDDEPWNHKTKLLNAPLKYPSELVALCRKHKVDKVVVFEGGKIELTAEQVGKLEQLGVVVERVCELMG